MAQRFVSIWFRHLITDWLIRKQPELKLLPFVLTSPVRGRVIITATNDLAEDKGIFVGMALADARALDPNLEVFDEKPELHEKLLTQIADWCIRYTPSVSISLTDGLMLDVSGCAHLMGGEHPFLKDIVTRLRGFGYDARASLADTPGAAWAVARFGRDKPIIESGKQKEALALMPPAALRLDDNTLDKLRKLGITKLRDLYKLPRSTLNRRFGPEICLHLDQALGDVQELVNPIRPIVPFTERVVYPDGLASAEGIAATLKYLLEKLCARMDEEQKGLRAAEFYGLRLDGIWEKVSVGTSRPTRSPKHIFKLFEDKLQTIEPALGIELFVLTAPWVEATVPGQDAFIDGQITDDAIPELVDRMANKLGGNKLGRYEHKEHHWPERSIKAVSAMKESIAALWPKDKQRPIRLLKRPEPIEVTAPVPDYPPMFFKYKGVMHRVRKADGPERIEREWWIEKEMHEPRDYFRIEDEQGQRYWVFRSGHFSQEQPALWFIHGFFP